MNQNLRMIATIVLCAGIYFVWMSFFAPKPQEQPTAPIVASQTSEPAPEIVNNIEAVATTPARLPETQAEPQTLTIQNEKASFTINTQGAVVSSVQLKDYKATAEETAGTKTLISDTPGSSALYLGLEGYSNLNINKTFAVQEQSESTLKVVWEDGIIRIEKTFALNANGSPYQLDAGYKITNLSPNTLVLKPYWQNQTTQKQLQESTGVLGFLSKRSTEAERYLPLYATVDSKKTKANPHLDWAKLSTLSQKTLWAGINDRYFLMAVAPMPLRDQSDTVYTRTGDSLNLKTNGETATLAPGQEQSANALGYFGPKKTDLLKSAGVNLEVAVDYGFFGILAQPILWLMMTIHSLIPSWGLAIILLTFIVKIVLYPINKKSMASMKAMQQLQPKLEEIRKKFPDDKQKQNVETMQLFRTHKVNPLGGCLPMLMQLPIYFALYRVLWNAIELYHTPFLHYKDLSAPDPYFIAPAILGVFMFLQQKFTPNPSSDPSQKKMMMLMPIFFSAVMLFLPVGLVIYIFINTAMSVLQQYLMRHDISLRDVLFRKVLRIKKADTV